MRPVSLLVLLLVLEGGCYWFDSSLPANAVLLCASTDDCPAAHTCDVEHHVCLAKAESLPRVEEARFEPAFTAGGLVTLVVRADRALSATAAPVVELVEDAGAPAGQPPAFVLHSLSGAEARLTLDASALADGVHRVARIVVTDTAGLIGATSLEDITLHVDRAGPLLTDAALLNVPPDGIWSDLPGSSRLALRFVSSEPLSLDETTITMNRLQGEPAVGVCASGARQIYTCELDIDADVDDRDARVALRAADLAGNATVVSLPVPVDVRAPDVVEDSVVVSIEQPGALPTIATPQSRIVVSFVLDEDVTAVPALTLAAASPVAFVLVERAGRFVRFAADDLPLEIGSYPVHATLTDDIGHVRERELPLPAPFVDGIPFGPPQSCPSGAGTPCVDEDGDGASAIAPDCPTGTDPDDQSLLVVPGAFEIPGDGLDNDALGGDASLDETLAVFVDSEAGDDATGDGTRAAPVRTLDAAQDLAALRPQPGAILLALAHRPGTPYEGTRAVSRSVIGGRAPGTWEDLGEVSDIEPGFTGGPLLIARVSTGGHSTLSSLTCVASRLGSLQLNGGVGRFFRCQVGASVPNNGVLIAFASVLGGVTLDGCDTARLHVTNSTVASVGGGCTSARLDLAAINSALGGVRVFNADVVLFHSVVRGTLSAQTMRLFSLGTIHQTLNGAPLIEHRELGTPNPARSSVVLLDTLLDQGGHTSALLTFGTVGITEEADVSAGNFPAAAEVDNVVFGAEGDLANLRDRARDATTRGAPPSVVADPQGACRFVDTAPDIGPGELP